MYRAATVRMGLETERIVNAPLDQVSEYLHSSMPPANAGGLSDETYAALAGAIRGWWLYAEPGRLREAVIASSGDGERVIRTPAWLMKQADLIELYAKPDDRWESNDVANRCPDIVEQLGKQFEAIHSLDPLLVAEESGNWENEWMSTYLRLAESADARHHCVIRA
mgnify:CR=1 FL=1